jgi:Zn-dependent protease
LEHSPARYAGVATQRPRGGIVNDTLAGPLLAIAVAFFLGFIAFAVHGATWVLIFAILAILLGGALFFNSMNS